MLFRKFMWIIIIFLGWDKKKLWNCSTYFVTKEAKLCIFYFILFCYAHSLYFYSVFYHSHYFPLAWSAWPIISEPLSYLMILSSTLIVYVICELRPINRANSWCRWRWASVKCTLVSIGKQQKKILKWDIFCSFKMVLWISYAEKPVLLHCRF